jgi:hypothetical protein
MTFSMFSARRARVSLPPNMSKRSCQKSNRPPVAR